MEKQIRYINCDYCGILVDFSFWGRFTNPKKLIQQRGGKYACGGFDECIDCYKLRMIKNQSKKTLRLKYTKYERLIYHDRNRNTNYAMSKTNQLL